MFKVFKWFRPLNWEDIESDPNYIATRDFTKSFKPEKDVNYSWIYQHSKALFDDISAMIRNQDTKAENLMRYLAPGSGLIGIALVWFNSLNGSELYINILVAVGMGFLILGMLSCLSALVPHQQASIPSVKDAVESCEYYNDGNRATAAFSKGIALAIAAKLVVNSRKASLLHLSYWFYAIGLIVLIVSMVIILW